MSDIAKAAAEREYAEELIVAASYPRRDCPHCGTPETEPPVGLIWRVKGPRFVSEDATAMDRSEALERLKEARHIRVTDEGLVFLKTFAGECETWRLPKRARPCSHPEDTRMYGGMCGTCGLVIGRLPKRRKE
jgi:hypothetical protein